ncbi:hypothetical protein EDD86DRAFT_55352 [Gorgonomyces haynaldii]|nr:hypothetical protein EDD86DRAFT_55352 [Gorgonomyces haynaldii]
MLLTAALLATAHAAAAPFLEFDPANQTEMDDTSHNNQFRIRLLKKPSASMTVYLEASGQSVFFAECSKTFTADNWNTFQVVKFRATPQYTTLANQTYALKARIFNTSAIDQTYAVKRVVHTGGQCSSTGDPHYKTFDGQQYTRMTDVPLWLFKSEHLDVQAVQAPCVPGSTIRCNKAAAIRYGSSVFVADARSGFNVSSILYAATGNADGAEITASNGNQTYAFRFPDGSTVTVSSNRYQNSTHAYVNINLNVPPTCGSNGGVCNKLGNTNGFVLARNGTWFNLTKTQNCPLGDAWTDSWNVPAAENLFNLKYTSSVPQWRSAVLCTVPSVANVIAASGINRAVYPQYTGSYEYIVPTSSIKTTSTAAPKTTSTTAAPKTTAYTTAAPKTTVAPTTVHYTTATATPTVALADSCLKECQDELKDTNCNLLLQITPYLGACKADCMLTGTFEFVESHKAAYLTDCKKIVDQLAKSTNKNETDHATKVQEKNGFGDKTCPNNCSGHGKCTDLGCKCDKGFGGRDCSRARGSNKPTATKSAQSPVRTGKNGKKCRAKKN